MVQVHRPLLFLHAETPVLRDHVVPGRHRHGVRHKKPHPEIPFALVTGLRSRWCYLFSWREAHVSNSGVSQTVTVSSNCASRLIV